MGRWVLGAFVVAVCLCTGKASGQVALGNGRTAGVTFHRPDPVKSDPAPSRPEPVTRSHGHRVAAPQPPGGDLFLARPDTYAPDDAKRHSRVRPHRSFSGSGYYPTAYLPAAALLAPEVTVVEPEPRGYLTLDIQPRTAQVIVDGLYAGTAEDFSGARSTLEPGPHRLDIRAPGHETVSVDIVIRPRQTTTFVKDLGRLEQPGASPATRPAPVATVARATPKSIYIIPRCYAGDRRPSARDLPDGCDIGDLRVIATAR